MIDFIDERLTSEIVVWQAVKNGWYEKVKALKESFDSIFDMLKKNSELPFEAGDELRFREALFDLIAMRHCGSVYEYKGYLRSFFQKYPKEHEATINYIWEMTRDERGVLPALSLSWSTILNKGESYPHETLKIYVDFLWHRMISDANFSPNLSPSMSEEQKQYWNSNESLLNEEIEPDKAQMAIDDWNSMTEKNLALGSCIEGFYYDGDESLSVIEGHTMQGFHLVALPKEIDEAMFDATMEYIKSYLFKKQMPIKTLKDIYTYYLPTNIRSETYKRQVIKNKSMISMLFVGLFCDRLYETKEVMWKRRESGKKQVETLYDAAECVAEFFTNIGFKYQAESVINARKKLLRILNELDVNYY
ncbi:hypothetical protein [Vibrio sp. 1S139]|uniref:hypothetical protein n=1 Tax=Vibrio sp. 1S139 TaxID=3230006 RepID=UPI00352E7924